MTHISDIQKVWVCFENHATDGSLALPLSVLDEYDEKGTFWLSVVNLVSMDNS